MEIKTAKARPAQVIWSKGRFYLVWVNHDESVGQWGFVYVPSFCANLHLGKRSLSLTWRMPMTAMTVENHGDDRD